MKTKFYWLALLASAAMIAQANAGGHHGGGGGFAASAGPARGGGPAFHAAPMQSFSGNRTISSVPRFAPVGVRSPALASSRQPAIGSNRSTFVGTRQFAPRDISRADRRVRFSNRGNQAITNVPRQANRPGQTRNEKNLPSNWRNHVVAQHSADWHRNWDRNHAHFDHGKVVVFINGFWWGLNPGFYPYYAYGYYPYDAYDYSYNNPYDYYGYYNPSENNGESAYVYSNQYGNNATVSAVQSELAKRGYYRGAIDGVEGDETQAALARYQEDYDLSITGTLTPGTLQALGLQ